MYSIIKIATLALLSLILNIANANQVQVQILIKNESTKDLEVGWIHPQTNKIENNALWVVNRNGGSMPLNSFPGHKFGVFLDKELVGTIVVKDQQGVQEFVVDEDLKVLEKSGNVNTYVSPWESGVYGAVKVLVLNDYGDEVMLSVLGEDDDHREGSLPSGHHMFIDAFVGQSVSIKSKVGEAVVQIAELTQQVVFITNVSEVMTTKLVDPLSYSNKLSKEEYSKIKKAEIREILAQCGEPGREPADCIRELTTAYLLDHTRQLQKIGTMRGFISDSWENYTCADPSLSTSPSLENKTFHYHNNTYDVQVLHKRPASQVHLLNNFIIEEECDAIEAAAKTTLHAAATEGDEPGKPSKVRKAMQAAVNVPYWNHSSPIARLGMRVIAYANHATNMSLASDGQEPLMSIQYKGNGPNDPFPDQYLPHCDGNCDASPHQPTGRVATMVLYCKVPDLGGATNFKNAGLHIVPKKHSAVFFSYINTDDNVMDSGFTAHSGCPVIEGRKILVTQWLRKGVSNEKPYSQYSADGNKYSSSYSESDHCENPSYRDYFEDLLPDSIKHTCPNEWKKKYHNVSSRLKDKRRKVSSLQQASLQEKGYRKK